MRLAVLNLTGGGMSGGHRKYLQGMIPRLVAAPEVTAILCATPTGLDAAAWLPTLSKVTYISCEPFRPFRHAPDNKLRKALDVFAPDLLFIPVERYIRYRDLPVVVMLQNMAPLTRVKTGAGLKEAFVGMARRYETRVALERSSGIIVPTGYVRDFLTERAGIPVARISTVYYGNDKPAGPVVQPAGFPFTAGDFIFTAGSMESYRGLEDLLAALPGLKETFPRIKLAIAGGSRPETDGYLLSLKASVDRLGLSGDVSWLGELSEGGLAWCYANCAAFALTSRMESFCFVALEALSAGCRVVSTRSACLPEVLSDAAEYYDAGDSIGLKWALAGVLGESQDVRSKASVRAMARAAQFDWDRAVAATLAVFRGALNLR